DAVEAAVALTDVGSHVVLVGSGMKSRAASIDPQQIVRRWLTVHGGHNYAPPDLESALKFLEQTGAAYPFAGLVATTFSLSEVNEAFAYAQRQRPVRLAVRP